MSDLVGLIDSGADQITDIELVANLVVLFNASFVTTMNLLGNGLLPMLARPELVDRARADADFAARCVEEILRYDSPVQLLSRVAARGHGAGRRAGRPRAASCWCCSARRTATRAGTPIPTRSTRTAPTSAT